MVRMVLVNVIGLGVSLFFTGCCAAPPPPIEPPVENPLPKVDAPEQFPQPAEPVLSVEPRIWTTVQDVENDCSKYLAEAQRIRDEIVAHEGERTLENTLNRLNDTYIELYAAVDQSSLFLNVSPIKEVRDAAETCKQKALKIDSRIQLDRDVYEAITAVKTDGLDAKAQRFVEHRLSEYKRAGVDKDEATRVELDKLKQKMVKLEQEFERRIWEDKLFIEVSKKDLSGLPEDFMATHPPGENGKIKITTAVPDFLPVLNHAEKEKVRKDIYYKLLIRAHPENEATLKELLTLRHKYATILGYSDWADYNAQDKMVKDKKVISDFIEEVSDMARPRMKRDLKEILARKKKDNRKTSAVKHWDSFYYVNKIRAEKYGVDARVVRSYFDYAGVRDGIMSIAQDLFGLTFELVENAPVWHDSVDVYNVFEGETKMGRFYLDMYPREGKFGQAAQFTLRTGVKDVQLPVAVLVCNFQAGSETGPGLMNHSQVTVFFHEFGHLLHNILAGHQDWITMSGGAYEADFVETPSQLFEEWSWDFDVLKRFAVHYETGNVIPEDLVKKMRLADEFGKGVNVMRQMFYTALSFYFHVWDPSEMDLLQTDKELQLKYSPYPYEKGTCTYCSFDHLADYTSAYYTYMWSLVLTKDLVQRFKTAGMMDKATAVEYRKQILEPGGSVDADQMMKIFLGKEYSFEAFRIWLESD
ncbi:MAG: Zn-dependent oligopeptidase [Proteobacteria bacterium]|nr:Zn-dependent oligopeptidase [Pseudomonadota bacterium]